MKTATYAAILCAALLCVPSLAQVIYVDGNAVGPGTGTQADPFPTIQAGVDAVTTDGTCVEIAPGYYAENVVMPPFKIELIGTQGAGLTIVDGGNDGPALDDDEPTFLFGHPQNTDSGVVGLTIIGGRGKMVSQNPEVWCGGGILCLDVEIGIKCCVFDSNEVIPYHGTPGPSEGWGGAIGWIGQGPEVIACTFIRNFAKNGGGAMGGVFAGAPTDRGQAYSCLMIENHTLGVGGAIGLRNANITAVNCTLSKNIATLGGGIGVSGAGIVADFHNMIVRDNASPTEIHIAGGAIPGFFDSNIAGGAPGGNSVGLIDVPPMFVDPNNNDFHLAIGSPMIDAAPPTPGMPATDFEGDPRISGAGLDIGADEFVFSAAAATAMAGKIGETTGGPVDIFTVNASSGDYARRVAVNAGGSIKFGMDQPPNNPFPAQFLLVGMFGTPDQNAITNLPFGMGSMVVEPAFMNPISPNSFTMANTFSPVIMPGQMLANPTPWCATMPVPAMQGYMTLQGIAMDDPFSPRATNAIVVEIL